MEGPQDVPNYALIQGIFIGSVAAYILILALIGPENHGRHFERGKTAFQAGASKEDVDSVPAGVDGVEGIGRSSVWSEMSKEKEVVQHVEGRRWARDGHV